MTDGDALYAAILEHPEEDTPRLMYADWMDEHDEAEYAEFIRLQIELAQPKPKRMMAKQKKERSKKEARVKELFPRIRPFINAPEGVDVRLDEERKSTRASVQAIVRRGFIEHSLLRERDTFNTHQDLVAMLPCISDLKSHPLLTIRAEGVNNRILEGIYQLVKDTKTASLELLHCASPGEGEEGMEYPAFEKSSSLSQMHVEDDYVDLWVDPLSMPFFRHLKMLELQGCRTPTLLLEFLREKIGEGAMPINLQMLGLRQNNLGEINEEEIDPIFDRKNMKSLKEVDLRDNDLEENIANHLKSTAREANIELKI
jgi:uncharacterized protein (TIGR02996 family)